MGAILVLSLFVISACQYQKPVGAPIGNNEETDEQFLSACRTGCRLSHERCKARCGEIQSCRGMSVETFIWNVIGTVRMYELHKCENIRITKSLMDFLFS